MKDDEGDAVSKIEDGPWPAFPADLTSIALALATQADGMVLIHEKMFENRLFFVDKLVSMGARVIVCDPHRAVVSGPSRLHAERMESPDIRAGMAMLIAALCAEGTSEIGNIRQIDRGYERIDERLRALGARIERVATEPSPCLGEAGPMIHPIPPGTRDVLPDEMRELRAITRGLRASFEGRATARSGRPRWSTRRCCARGDENAAGAGFRTFDEQGNVLALRSDMTIPIARVVATRYPDEPGPLRLCYFAHAYRAVERGTGQQREFLQGGIELIGVDGARGRGRGDRADAGGAGRGRAWRATGSAWATGRSTARCCASSRCPRTPLLERLARARPRRAGAAWWTSSGWPKDARDLLVRLPELRGGPEVLDEPIDALDGLRTLYAELERARRGRPRDPRPRPGARCSATTPARCTRSTTPPWGSRSAAAGATTT